MDWFMNIWILTRVKRIMLVKRSTSGSGSFFLINTKKIDVDNMQIKLTQMHASLFMLTPCDLLLSLFSSCRLVLVSRSLCSCSWWRCDWAAWSLLSFTTAAADLPPSSSPSSLLISASRPAICEGEGKQKMFNMKVVTGTSPVEKI